MGTGTVPIVSWHFRSLWGRSKFTICLLIDEFDVKRQFNVPYYSYLQCYASVKL